MAEQGKKIVMAVSIYLLVKQVLNVVIGDAVSSMLIPVMISVFCYLNLWKYTNYVAAAVIALIAAKYLPDNLRNLPDSWLYLSEGILDMIAAVILVISQDVKAYFNKS